MVMIVGRFFDMHWRGAKHAPDTGSGQKGIGAVVVNSESGRMCMQDAMTWVNNLSGEGAQIAVPKGAIFCVFRPQRVLGKNKKPAIAVIARLSTCRSGGSRIILHPSIACFSVFSHRRKPVDFTTLHGFVFLCVYYMTLRKG